MADDRPRTNPETGEPPPFVEVIAWMERNPQVQAELDEVARRVDAQAEHYEKLAMDHDYYRTVGPGRDEPDPGQPLRWGQIEAAIYDAYDRGFVADGNTWTLLPVDSDRPRYRMRLTEGEVSTEILD